MYAPLSTQIQAGVDTFKSVILKVRPYKNAPPLRLAVAGGMHDACSHDVQLEAIHIGSGQGNDLVFLDPGVADTHMHIAVSYSLLGPLAIVTATGAAVEVNGQLVDKGDASKHVRLPLEFSVGDGISVTLSKRTAHRPKKSFDQRAVSHLMTSVVFLGALTAGLIVWETSNGQPFVLRPAYVSAAAMDTSSQIEVSAKSLRQKLVEVGLDQTLLVVETEDGFLKVRGRMSPSQARIWEDVAVWYDTVSYAKPMLTYFENADELPRMPPISLVRLTEPKEVVLSGGKAIGINATLSGDWKVAAIERDHIVISRNGDREILRFAGPAK